MWVGKIELIFSFYLKYVRYICRKMLYFRFLLLMFIVNAKKPLEISRMKGMNGMFVCAAF